MAGEINEQASPSDMMDLAGFWEERRRIYERVSDTPGYQEKLKENKEAWMQGLRNKFPKLESSNASLDEAIRGITFIDYLVRNELRTADAPFLQPKVIGSSDPTMEVGIEDLIDKFISGNFSAANEQVQKARDMIDGTAFSTRHNIHIGLLPLYIVREEALGLGGHLRALEKAK